MREELQTFTFMWRATGPNKPGSWLGLLTAQITGIQIVLWPCKESESKLLIGQLFTDSGRVRSLSH